MNSNIHSFPHTFHSVLENKQGCKLVQIGTAQVRFIPGRDKGKVVVSHIGKSEEGDRLSW